MTRSSLAIPGTDSDGFGAEVSVSGDTLLFSAPTAFGSGSAYIVTRSGTSWSYLQALTPTGGGGSDYAGGLAVSGGNAVVTGLPGGNITNWVFSRTGLNWFQQGMAISPSTAANTPVVPSRSIAVDGSAFVTGAFYGASVYSTAGDQPQSLTPSDFLPGAAGSFGFPVAINGNNVLVGAGPIDTQGQTAHWAYVYTKSGSVWTQQARLVPSDLPTNSGPAFRFTVAIEADTAVLATTFGAYVFTRSGTAWTQTQKILPVTANGPFGTAVGLSGNLLVIGGGNNVGGAGQVYVFGRSKDTWLSGPTLSTGASADGFGLSLALNQGTLVVGAQSKSSVYVYSCTP